MSEKISRTRNYATVVYEESAPHNWKDILEQQFVPSLISPIHDKDVNPGGEPKKPHYHVIVMFDNVKTLKQAKQLFSLINGVGCEVVNSPRGYSRYLCHLDNPEKAKYDVSDVVCLAGADYHDIIKLNSDKYVILSEMQDFCSYFKITSFYKLSNYARLHKQDWYKCLCDNGSFFMKEYLKSMQWSFDQGVTDEIIDPISGEVYDIDKPISFFVGVKK